jgi:hypothetical protein
MGIEEAVESGKLEESGSDPNFAGFDPNFATPISPKFN